MESKKPFGWAYIGAGSIANITAKKIIKSGNHKIVSVYNRTYSKAEIFGKKFNSKPCKTIKEAVLSPGVEGAYINTVATNHFIAAKEVLELGVPVLLEKPFTLNCKETKELFKIAKENNTYVAEAMWTWFSPVALKVKEWIDSGEIGTITSANINFAMANALFSKRLLNPKLGGGALLDLGIYPLTYCYNLFGMPNRITCKSKLKNGVDVTDSMILEYDSGLTPKLYSSVVNFKHPKNLVLKGTKGTIEAYSFHSTNSVKLKKRQFKSQIFKSNGGYDNQFTKVAQEIRSGLLESNFVPHSSTLNIMKLLDSCRAQIDLIYPSEEG